MRLAPQLSDGCASRCRSSSPGAASSTAAVWRRTIKRASRCRRRPQCLRGFPPPLMQRWGPGRGGGARGASGSAATTRTHGHRRVRFAGLLAFSRKFGAERHARYARLRLHGGLTPRRPVRRLRCLDDAGISRRTRVDKHKSSKMDRSDPVLIAVPDSTSRSSSASSTASASAASSRRPPAPLPCAVALSRSGH